LLAYLTPHERAEMDGLLTDPDPLTPYREDASRILRWAGYPPDPWQAQVARDQSPTTLLLCARQAGKTLASAAAVLRQAMLFPRSLVLILAPTRRQSEEMLHQAVYPLYDGLGAPVSARRRLELSLELANGSRIIALPDNEAGIRCFSSVSLLMIDEAARVPDDLYHAATPMLARRQGKLLAASTPYGKRGWFYDLWERGAGCTRYPVRAGECSQLSPAFLAAEYQRKGPRWYAQEFELAFNDSVDQLFSQDVIEQALACDVAPRFPGG
jgi:hypothetical protein